ncbi:MAG: hypothetical protein ACFFDL_13880, partial [Promethearchaeota archaeon]
FINNHKRIVYHRSGVVHSVSIRLKNEKFSILSILKRLPQKAHTKKSTRTSFPHLGHLVVDDIFYDFFKISGLYTIRQFLLNLANRPREPVLNKQ